MDGFSVGDGVFAAALSRAVASSTASAVLDVWELGLDDTVLIGGAGGGAGVFAVQLARIAGRGSSAPDPRRRRTS